MMVLEKRAAPSRWWSIGAPLLALGMAVVLGALLFAVLGHAPSRALYVYFVEPLTSAWSLEELAVKATPLMLIGAGLALAYRANVWNIGAEGQLIMGAIAGSAIPILLPGWNDALAMLAMLLLGAAGGAAYAAIPAWLKNRFNTNEILTSLMLVYVAGLFLDWLVRGPWRDPMGFNFPKSVAFDGWHVLPTLTGRVHLGFVLALLAVLILWVIVHHMRAGLAVRVQGIAPRAARFGGFSAPSITLGVMLFSGALAGLAGIGEVAGAIGHLQPSISPGYGFAAIIVAVLGRLSPIGVVFAAFLLALTYLGGEAAQLALNMPAKVAQAFQGLLLFLILAAEVLVHYRIRWRGRAHGAARARQGGGA